MTERQWYRAGQAIAIGRSLAIMVMMSLLYVVGNDAMTSLKSEADVVVANETAQTGLDYTFAVWENFLFIVLAVTIIGTIAIAVYQSRGGF